MFFLQAVTKKTRFFVVGAMGKVCKRLFAETFGVFFDRAAGWAVPADADANASRRTANNRPLRMGTDEYG